jgi:sugar phosphate isomerase/epimerase
MNRRGFLKSAGLGLAAMGVLGTSAQTNSVSETKANNRSFKLGCAGYTFVRYDLDKSLEMMHRVNVRQMSLKDFHLPINASDEKIQEVLSKFKSRNITPYGVGPIYMRNEAEVTNAFQYAKKVGVKLVIAVPNYELLPLVEKKVKEYDFKVAIHIHGPDIAIFPHAADVWEHVKGLDERIGICHDIGHTVRLGINLIEDIKKYSSRIYDMHIWDVDKAEKSGHCVEGGRGIINFKELFDTLQEVGYSGVCSLEYTKDMNDVLPGVAESIGYFNGVLSLK